MSTKRNTRHSIPVVQGLFDHLSRTKTTVPQAAMKSDISAAVIYEWKAGGNPTISRFTQVAEAYGLSVVAQKRDDFDEIRSHFPPARRHRVCATNDRAHPLVRDLFRLAHREGVGMIHVLARAGVCRNRPVVWGRGASPDIFALESSFEALGYQLVLVRGGADA